MTPNDLPGGIPSRVSGLTAGFLRHFLAIGALAAAEGRLFLRQSIGGIILLVVLVFFALIAYVTLLTSVICLIAILMKWGWPVSLAAAGMLHLALVAILYRILKARMAPRPFEATTAELQRDIDALGTFSNNHSR
jgi:uncharacterized membrane protein YqjE